MRVLAFDTTMAACSVALWHDGQGEAVFCNPMMHGQAEALMPAIEQVLSDAGKSYDAVDRIAVTIGPGSFTGVRVGLAAARGLSMAMDQPAIGVLTTDVLAEDVHQPNPDRPIAVAIDARRAEVYMQCFDHTGTSIDQPQCLLPEEAASYLATLPNTSTKSWCLTGDGAERLAQAVTFDHEVVCPRYPDAMVLAAIAANRPVPDHQPRPVYVRPPDAALPKSGGQLRP